MHEASVALEGLTHALFPTVRSASHVFICFLIIKPIFNSRSTESTLHRDVLWNQGTAWSKLPNRTSQSENFDQDIGVNTLTQQASTY